MPGGELDRFAKKARSPEELADAVTAAIGEVSKAILNNEPADLSAEEHLILLVNTTEAPMINTMEIPTSWDRPYNKAYIFIVTLEKAIFPILVQDAWARPEAALYFGRLRDLVASAAHQIRVRPGNDEAAIDVLSQLAAMIRASFPKNDNARKKGA